MLICGLAKYSVYHVIQHVIRCSPVLQQSTIIVTPKITCTHNRATIRLMWWRQCGAVAVTQHCRKLTIGPRLDERYTSNLQTPPALQYRNLDMRIHNILSTLRDNMTHAAAPVWPQSTIIVTQIINSMPAAICDPHTTFEPHTGRWRQCGICDDNAELGYYNAGLLLSHCMATSSQ